MRESLTTSCKRLLLVRRGLRPPRASPRHPRTCQPQAPLGVMRAQSGRQKKFETLVNLPNTEAARRLGGSVG